MQDRIGESFAGTLSGVTSFGVFVALDEVYVEGLVHVTDLGNDYFQFDPARHELLGERTGRRFRLGDRLRVKLARVNLESSKIDFVLEEAALPEEEGTPGRPGRRQERKAASSAKPARKARHDHKHKKKPHA
jgi:ribonuclease R